MSKEDRERESGGRLAEERSTLFDVIEGLTRVDPAEIAEFEQAMADQTVPEIVKVVEERRLRAVETRRRELKL